MAMTIAAIVVVATLVLIALKRGGVDPGETSAV